LKAGEGRTVSRPPERADAPSAGFGREPEFGTGQSEASAETPAIDRFPRDRLAIGLSRALSRSIHRHEWSDSGRKSADMSIFYCFPVAHAINRASDLLAATSGYGHFLVERHA